MESIPMQKDIGLLPVLFQTFISNDGTAHETDTCNYVVDRIQPACILYKENKG
jgi:hypothetical protein